MFQTFSYARSGDVAIAYQVVGEGPTDLVFLPFVSGLWWLWTYRTSSRLPIDSPSRVGSSSSTRAAWASPIGHAE